MEEIWKDIKGYEWFYQVSNLGGVKSLSRLIKRKVWTPYNGKALKGHNDKDGYLKVLIRNNEIVKYLFIHRLVAISFMENQYNKPQVNHIDGNKKNNVVENLEWCSAHENRLHAYKIGLQSKVGEKHHMVKLKEKNIFKIRNLFASGKMKQREIAQNFNVTPHTISDIHTRRSWTHLI